MKIWLALLTSLLLAGCAVAPKVPAIDGLLDDALFAPPSVRIDAGEVLALSARMKAYVANHIAPKLHYAGPQMSLVQALYEPRELRLDYDATVTRTAAQAFDEQAGNCLSLVIMTAAFAKELGLPVRFQNVLYEETWARSSDLVLSIGHINLALGRNANPNKRGFLDSGPDWLVVDFLPGQDLRRQRTQDIDEARVLAMFMNNRAAEALALGQVDNAYWWAREALRQDRQFISSYNTLGVVYRRHGKDAQAERVFRFALQVEPDNPHPMGNLVQLLRQQGRNDEAQVLAQRLAAVQPIAPFASFGEGLLALQGGQYRRAKTLFETEIRRTGDYHELHYWLGVALLQLGETAAARKHLEQAMTHSATLDQRARYAAKLDRLKQTKVQ